MLQGWARRGIGRGDAADVGEEARLAVAVPDGQLRQRLQLGNFPARRKVARETKGILPVAAFQASTSLAKTLMDPFDVTVIGNLS